MARPFSTSRQHCLSSIAIRADQIGAVWVRSSGQRSTDLFGQSASGVFVGCTCRKLEYSLEFGLQRTSGRLSPSLEQFQVAVVNFSDQDIRLRDSPP
jgi:hypothetical protein